MMHNLTQLLSDLWNKVKRDSHAPTLRISEDDMVVFVMGPTGSGKSWFTRDATRSGLVEASGEYHPFTKEVQAIRCELTDEAKRGLQGRIKSIVFVDTPSFLTGCEPDAREEFEKWFSKAKYKPRAEYVRIIYMHRIETDPALEPMQNHLREISAVFRGDNRVPRRLRIVISYDKTSSNVSIQKIEERSAKIRDQLDKLQMSGWDLSIHEDRFEGEPEVAWNAVAELFRD